MQWVIMVAEGYNIKWNIGHDSKYKFIFQNKIRLKAFFINTHYEDVGTDKAKEKFDEYTEKLWKFATSVDPFPMKDIEIVYGDYLELLKKLAG